MKSKNEGDIEEILVPNFISKIPIPILDSAVVITIASIITKKYGLDNVSDYLQYATGLFMGSYFFSALLDATQRTKVKKIDFKEVYGKDLKNLKSMKLEDREGKIKELTEKLNDEYVPQNYKRKELAEIVNEELTNYISGITKQRIITSPKVRSFGISKLIYPFAAGGCDILGCEVYIFKKLGVFEPYIIGHEFAHRKRYMKELEAQVITYYSFMSSNNPVLVQSANCEELNGHFVVLSDWNRYVKTDIVENSGLRPELKKDFMIRRGKPGLYENIVSKIMLPLYNLGMKLSGQNGLHDYDEGFTNFINS